MTEKNEWYTCVDNAFAEALRIDKPVFLFFCSRSCFLCHQMNIAMDTSKEVSSLIREGLVALRATPDTPEVFHTYAVKNVPELIIADTDGFEYERCTGFLDPPNLTAFFLFSLGKIEYDRGKKEAAERYIEALVENCPQSIYAPEGVLLRGIYRYQSTGETVHLKQSFETLAENYTGSIWVKRALVLHCHPSAIVNWETERKMHRDYWESQDAFVKSYATTFNGLSVYC